MQELEVIEIDGVKIPHTTYAEYGVQGVGNKHRPIVNMDQYIDKSKSMIYKNTKIKKTTISINVRLIPLFLVFRILSL